MSQHDDAFWALVEQFIEVANDAPDSLGLTEVGGALLCAAARFNAYAVAASSIDRKSFKEDCEQTLTDYGSQFKGLLAEDLADYAENYKIMIGNKDEESDA